MKHYQFFLLGSYIFVSPVLPAWGNIVLGLSMLFIAWMCCDE